MIETAFGIILGGIISWIVAHWYFRKQEQTSPAPLLKEINNKVQELHELAVIRRDKELQNKLKDLNRLISNVSKEILTLLLPLDIETQALNIIYQSGDKKNLEKYLKEFIPDLIKFHDQYIRVHSELKNLSDKTANFEENRGHI